MDVRIVELTRDRQSLIDQAAQLLHEAFRGRSAEWQDLESARLYTMDCLTDEKIRRVALDHSDRVVGWIAATPAYGGRVWEIDVLAVSTAVRRHGIGRALVHDLERIAHERGVLTLWAGTDDENDETTLSGVDLYADLPGAIQRVRNLGGHPYEFYVRVGFTIVGVMPDANGPGKPDIFVAKRVRGVAGEIDR
jgi:aminoglycoside 6'-N-acetyltransferase I